MEAAGKLVAQRLERHTAWQPRQAHAARPGRLPAARCSAQQQQPNKATKGARQKGVEAAIAAEPAAAAAGAASPAGSGKAAQQARSKPLGDALDDFFDGETPDPPGHRAGASHGWAARPACPPPPLPAPARRPATYPPMVGPPGFVTIIGKPNAGKSTLMNALLGQPLSIVTAKVQTTRHRILGILSEPAYQAVFLDTPGVFDKSRDLLDQKMLAAVQRVGGRGASCAAVARARFRLPTPPTPPPPPARPSLQAVKDADCLLAIVDVTHEAQEALAMVQPGDDWKGPPMAVVRGWAAPGRAGLGLRMGGGSRPWAGRPPAALRAGHLP